MKDKCDFCKKIKNVDVYATDFAPVSLCYCNKCLKVNNIRPRETAIYGWARLGKAYFTPYELDGIKYPPMVYSEGKYITVEEFIGDLTEEKIKMWITGEFRLKLCLEKFKLPA